MARSAWLEYVGVAGATQECVDAVLRLIQYNDSIEKARILSASGSHCLLLTINCGDLVAIKSGFASGYGGEGPYGLSYVLRVLVAHRVDIEEYDVDQGLLDRLDASALTMADIKRIDMARPVRPTRFYDYIYECHNERAENGTLWQEFRPIIPLAIIDSRIMNLAISFWENPNDRLFTGYKRLEDIIRDRTGIKDEHSSKLFSTVFFGEPPRLGWPNLDKSERIGRANLFANAYMAHRNPLAHREKSRSPNQISEFLLLNHLYLLEKEAIESAEPLSDMAS